MHLMSLASLLACRGAHYQSSLSLAYMEEEGQRSIAPMGERPWPTSRARSVHRPCRRRSPPFRRAWSSPLSPLARKLWVHHQRQSGCVRSRYRPGSLGMAITVLRPAKVVRTGGRRTSTGNSRGNDKEEGEVKERLFAATLTS